MEDSKIEGVELKTIPDLTTNDKPTRDYTPELENLKSLAKRIFITLGLIIVISGILLGIHDNLFINLIWTCIIAGILGSATSALISALQRKANGWETEDGLKHPAEGKKDMFSQRMATFFLYRPAFGIIGGLLIYFGMKSKYFGETGLDNQAEFIFWSLLSGLFVKSLIEKLKDLFDSLVGKK